jgi:sugar lactone lactonase YvrE
MTLLRKLTLLAALLLSAAPLLGQPLQVEWLAGSTSGGGYYDGRFSAPRAIATDAAGNVYVADTGNHAIRKIHPNGTVTTLAGLPGAPGGYADGAGTLARFRFPAGIAIDPTSGAIYVSDKDNHVIRRILNGVVTTIAGEPGVAGAADAQGTAAKFAFPRGLVVDANGIIFVADAGNHAIRRVTPDGIVTTFAGRIRFPGVSDGTGTNATFAEPSDIALDPTTGNFYVADYASSLIRRITPAAVVTTVAGRVTGDADGTGAGASFRNPWGLEVDASGTVWVADTGNNKIRRMTPGGFVTTMTDDAYFPSSIAIGPGGVVFIADTGSHAILRFDGALTTYAGSQPFLGPLGNASSFSFPADVAIDLQGNIFVAQSGTLKKITPQGQISEVGNRGANIGVAAGPDGSIYYTDIANDRVYRLTPSGQNVLFAVVPVPRGIAVDSAGFVYVSSEDHSIRRIAPGGGVANLAGGLIGFFDGTGTNARFNYPLNLEVDDLGNVYVTDWGNNAIRKVTAAGVVSTIATGIFGPNGIARDAAGNLYVSDYNHSISRITPAGVVTTVAGLQGSPGNAIGVGDKARFYYPAGMTMTADGRLIIADEFNHAIKEARVFTPHKRRAARR